ncbi:nitroreductase family protein [Crassaminicella indica]|uniref:Nitroreductase family protein n=1 Tax=Crassaminicella indica TaxID=2855394 RepID=A0ABX8RCT4_9CLOT|nr:nitroreductase family protein [Crassaminicella indica]QXM05530.1 nitroreductase family protein [Crassaminicella indica]
MSNLEFIYKRHSVRRFKEDAVPVEDIKKMIEAATYAPSGKNVQNWHFVVITNKEKIEQIAKIIERKNAELADALKNEAMKKSFTKFLRFSTVFRNAPVLVLVYTETSYKPTGLDVLKEIGASTEEIHNLSKTNPAIQNIGAAMENLMLAAANMGYGTCWMTSSNYAAKEIEAFIGLDKENYFLAAMTPIGVPSGELKSPPRKSVEEVLTIIE